MAKRVDTATAQVVQAQFQGKACQHLQHLAEHYRNGRFTAWETYVENRIYEVLRIQLRLIAGSHCGDFSKTKQLFLGYLGVDVTDDH